MKVLKSFGYERDRQRGSHVVLTYRNLDTGEVRTVTVPLHDRLKTGIFSRSQTNLGPTTYINGVGDRRTSLTRPEPMF